MLGCSREEPRTGPGPTGQSGGARPLLGTPGSSSRSPLPPHRQFLGSRPVEGPGSNKHARVSPPGFQREPLGPAFPPWGPCLPARVRAEAAPDLAGRASPALGRPCSWGEAPQEQNKRTPFLFRNQEAREGSRPRGRREAAVSPGGNPQVPPRSPLRARPAALAPGCHLGRGTKGSSESRSRPERRQVGRAALPGAGRGACNARSAASRPSPPGELQGLQGTRRVPRRAVCKPPGELTRPGFRAGPSARAAPAPL